MLVQACLNGARAPGEHPALPLTPAQLAADAAAVVAAGARSLHLHVRDREGAESLAPDDVAAVLAAVRAAAPGVEISLSTGLWITAGDVERRHALVAAWTATPALVSLNLSEPGWEDLAALLAARGIGVEAGVATTADAGALARGGLQAPERVLVEIDDESLTAGEAVAAAAAIDTLLDGAGVVAPRLHHGYGPATWAVLDAAVPRGRDIRIGLEDVLELPGGEPAPGNPALVSAAVARYGLGSLAQISAGGAVYVVERATVTDVAAIVDLLAADQIGATRDGGDLRPYEQAFAGIDADPAQLLVVLRDASRQVVGTLQLTFIPGLARRGAWRAQIEAVRIREDLRGRGLGHELMSWAIQEASRRGCALVQLTSDKRRAGAHRFYGRLGFEASHDGFKLRLTDE